MQAGHGDAFAPFVDLACPGLSVAPMIACTSIQQDRDEEEVDQATGQLGVVTPILLPLFQCISDARDAAGLEVLPAAVGRDGVEAVGAVVTLSEDLLVSSL